MKTVRFDPAPGFAAFGVLTPAGEGAARLLPRGGGREAGRARAAPGPGPIATEAQVDLPALCGEPPQRFRRMDRYGALGYAAAHRALAGAAPSIRPAPLPAAPAGAEADPDWGVMIGSSLACWGSIAQHDRDLRDRPMADLSPAVFVRTVANAVNGDISIGWRLGGPSETFVSGWTAGAEALAAAGTALLLGRARWILAGAVEAPDAVVRGARTGRPQGLDGEGPEGTLVEGAAISIMGIEVRAHAAEALRLRAYLRGHDPGRRFSLAAAIDSLGPFPAGTVIVANTIPTDLMDRIREEAGSRWAVLHLPQQCGELGATGAVVAVALADALTLEASWLAADRLADEAPEGVLVIARDPEGGTAVLALSR